MLLIRMATRNRPLLPQTKTVRVHPVQEPATTPPQTLPGARPNLGTAFRPFASGLYPLIAALCLLWFILCKQLSSEWSINEQYSYGWFVPFFAVYLFWLKWEDRSQMGPRLLDLGYQLSGTCRQAAQPDNKQPITYNCPDRHSHNSLRITNNCAATLALLLLGLLLPLRAFEVGNPDWRPLGWLHALIVVGVTGILLWRVGGIAWLKHFAFPICFIFVAVPWVSGVETPIIQGLMRSVAAVAAETLNLFGIPAQLEGNLIRVSTGPVGVNEACSGVRSLQTSLMIGLLFGELKKLALVRRLLLLAGAVAIAITANCLRALFLVWIASSQQPDSVHRWHDLAGYSIVAAVFLGTVVLAAILAPRVGRGSSKRENHRPVASNIQALASPSRSPFPLSTSYCLVCLLWLVVTEASVETWYRVHERNLVIEPRWTVRWPTDEHGFRILEIDEGVKRTLRFDNGSEVAWSLASPANNPQQTTSNARVNATSAIAYFFRWNAGGSSVVRARAHSPEICLPDAGWQKTAEFGTRAYQVGAIAVPFRQIVFRKQTGHAFAHTFFCLQEDQGRPNEERPDLRPFTGTQPAWGLAARARIVRNGVRNLGQQVLEIAFVGSEPMTDEAAEAQFAALLRTIIVQAK